MSCDKPNVNRISPQHSRHIKHRNVQCLCRKQATTSVPKQGNFSTPSFTETVLSLTHCSRNLRKRMWSQHSVECTFLFRESSYSFTLPSCPPHFTNHSYAAVPRYSRSKLVLTSPATESRSDWGSGHRCQPEQSREEGDFHSPPRRPGSDRSLPTEKKVPEVDQGWRRGADVRWLTLTRWVYTSKCESILVKIVQVLSAVTGNVLEPITRGLKN